MRRPPTFLLLLFLLWLPVSTRAGGESPAPFSEPAAVLLNLSERDLNRIVVDSFRKNGGPEFHGEKARVSSSVADLRYRASLTDPVVRLGDDGTAHLSLSILDANVRIGRLERRVGPREATCEEAGIDVDPQHPLDVGLALDLGIENGGLKIRPTSVEIPEAEERLQLVKPARCTNALLPRWFLWWVGKPFLRRSLGDLDEMVLKRARKSAARLEAKQGDVLKRGVGAELHLVPEAIDTSGGSLLVGLSASAEAPGAAPPRGELPARSSLPHDSFVGVSEPLVNEVARRVLARRPGSRRVSPPNVRKLLASDAVYALIPGLRGIGSKENVYFEVSYPTAPRFEFRDQDHQAVIRVLLSDVAIQIRRGEGERSKVLGTLRVDAARMAVTPVASLLGGISFRLVENQWRVSSSGLQFNDDLVAATLQEITFGKIFATTYEPLLTKAMRLGETQFLPRSFAVIDRYLVIGLGEPPPRELARSASAARRTDSLHGSR